MLFISSLFPRLNCTICPEMKKRIAKTVFLDSFCCCYLFGKHLRGQNKIVQSALAHEFKEKKDGNVDGRRERKGRAYLLEIGNNFTRLSISRVDAIKTKGTITFFLVNNGEAKDCPCEGREDKHNKVNKNNPADSFGQPLQETAGSDTQYVSIRFSPPPQNSKLDLGISVQGSLACPRPY